MADVATDAPIRRAAIDALANLLVDPFGDRCPVGLPLGRAAT